MEHLVIKMKGVGGPLDIMSNVLVLILGVILLWFGSTGGSLGPLILIILGIVLIISQIVAIVA